MNRVFFATFADSKYKKSLLRLKKQINECQYITDKFFFTEKDLDKDFKKQFHPWLYRRGYGYWKWKSYLVKKVLNILNDGDILIWSDVGNVFNIQAEKRLLEYFKMVSTSESGLLVFSQDKIEKDWTKADCFNFLGVQENKEITETSQYWAGCFLICKNKNSVDFINKWEGIVTQHFDLITDKSSIVPNSPTFIEHRHDQSVFSIFAKLYHANTCLPEEIDKNNFEMIPFQPKRFKQKNILVNLWYKILIPYRYCIGLYLKLFKKFYFRNRIAW